MSRSGAKVKGRGASPGRPAPARVAAAEVVRQFAEALSLHQSGRLMEAEALYRGILERDAGHFEARHHLGIIHHQRGEHIAAIRLIDAALQLSPNVAAAHNNRGVALAALRRVEDAVESYGRAIELKPDYVDALFNRGNALKNLQRFDAALASYDKVLALAPGHALAWAHRGNVLHALQRYDEAVASHDRAVALKPDFGEALNNRAATLARLGRFTEAVASCERAIALQPHDPEALGNRGRALAELGRFDEAVASYDRALALTPADAELLGNRGLALAGKGSLEEAAASYDRAIALRPDHADAFNDRAVVLSKLGRFAEAIESCDRAIALRPDSPDAFSNRGNALCGLKRFDDALASFEAAIAIEPDHVDAANNRGNALKDLKRFDEALASYERAIALKPDHAEYHNNRAIVLAELKRYDEALASYDTATVLKPDYADAFNNRGFALRDMGRLDEASASFARALALRPDYDYLRGTYLHAKMHVCDWTDFHRDCAEVQAAAADGKPVALPFQLLATPASPAQQRRAAERYASDKYGASRAPLWRGERYVHDRIRIAYVSADFREHAITALTSGLFERHDRTRFETVAISFKSDTHNRVRERLSGFFDRFIDARRMSDREVARLVRELEIDVAVDLNGFTEGGRPDIFAQRPAPVQVNYLGYAGTLGAAAWDYVVADRFVIPTSDHAHYVEKVVYLPDSFMVNDCGRKIADRTPTRARAGLPERGLVFCCFNNSFKITPDVFDVWMRLLGGVAGSVLWLSAANASAVANLRREAEHRGIAGDRLVFAPRVALNEDHLARLRLADLFVDTLYYNAHTTAADALWAGVPVLTCAGATFASRVAGSLLGAVGLPELVTYSLGEYEALALALGRDPERLTGLRRKLERNRDVHPLFDTGRFTHNIEAAYTTMWQRAQRGEPPQSFAVAEASDAAR